MTVKNIKNISLFFAGIICFTACLNTGKDNGQGSLGVKDMSNSHIINIALEKLALSPDNNISENDLNAIKQLSVEDPNFLKIDLNDTVYMCMTCSFAENGIFTVWNKHHSYSNVLSDYNGSKLGMAYGLEHFLIEKWDTASIGEISKAKDGEVELKANPQKIAIRIVVKNGEIYKIDKYDYENRFNIPD